MTSNMAIVQALELQKIQMEQAKVRLWEEQRRQEAAHTKREQLLAVAKATIVNEKEPPRRM